MKRWITLSLVILALMASAGVASAERGDIGGPPLTRTATFSPSTK